MQEDSTMTESMGSRATAAGTERPYLGPMGRGWLLPLYDPLSLLLGARTAHSHLLDAADLRPGHRVLEIGCGTGNLALLAKVRQPAATVVGLDPDAAALARARVLSALMLHHLPDDQKPAALREVGRVLRPGGELHLVDIAGGDGGHRRALLHQAQHDHDRPGSTVADLLHAAGLTEVSTGTVRVRLGLSLTTARAVR
jgi:ubiquinone/menaquinone biosynthesis C-methylase UbiE